MIKNDAGCTREIKSWIAKTKAAFSKNGAPFTSKLDLNLRKKLVKCYIWNIASYGAETLTFLNVDQKYLVSSETWCWGRKEKISWTERVRKEEVLQRVKEERNTPQKIKRRNANGIGPIFRRNCILKHFIEGKIGGGIELTERRGRRRKQLLDDLKEKRGHWKLEEEALDRTLWRSRFGRDYGLVV
jgi:hypothetical protein